jgi:hypothetical protein
MTDKIRSLMTWIWLDELEILYYILNYTIVHWTLNYTSSENYSQMLISALKQTYKCKVYNFKYKIGQNAHFSLTTLNTIYF